MVFCGRRRPELIIISTCMLYISVGGLMNSALNNPADDVNDFIQDSFSQRYNVTLSVELSAWMWSSVIFSFMVGSFAGSLFAHQLADRLGRKPTLMYFSSTLYLLASVCFYLARPLNLFELVIAGRLITGVSNGIANPILATYLVESIPLDLSGFAGCMLDFCGCVGSFLGIFLSTDLILGTPNLWHHLLGGPCVVFGALQLVTSALFHESPKFLLLHQNQAVRAAQACEFFYGPRVTAVEISRTLSGFIADERHPDDGNEYEDKILSTGPPPMSRSKIILLSAVLGTLPLICGYTILLNYSTEILISSGLSENTSELYTTVMGIFEVLGGLGSLFVNYRSPRRFVLLFCSIFCLIFMFLIVLLLFLHRNFPSIIFLHSSGVTISLITALSVIGPFPLYLLLPAEFARQKFRALATSLASTSYYLISILTLLTFYPLLKAIGSFALVPPIVIGVAVVLLIYIHLPETSPGFVSTKEDLPSPTDTVPNGGLPERH